MGLAASQARFLAITARKNNCEFRSMEIAQQKLSITRDLQKAADDYQNSLNATKLVWNGDNNSDGTGTTYDLSYAIMMTPSALNEYDPYLITDTQGKIVLSDSMYNAAVKAGIIDAKTGDPTGNGKFSMGSTNSTDDGSRNAFLYQLGVANEVSTSTINTIYALGSNGYTASGVGGEIADKTMANAMPTATFINYLSSAKCDEAKTETIGTSAGEVNISYEKGDALYGLKLLDVFGVSTSTSSSGSTTGGTSGSGGTSSTGKSFESVFCTTTTPDSKKDANKILITKNGKALSQNEIESLTLGDILSGKYEMSGIMSTEDFATKAQDVLLAMANLLGYNAADGNIKGLNVNNESDAALDQAYVFSQLLVSENYAVSASSGGTMYKSVQNAISKAQETNCITEGNRNVRSISLSNLLKSYLTYFSMSMEGYDSGFNIDKESSKDSIYITDDLSYYFLLTNDDAQTSQDILNADFYNQLYNNLCMYGACSDATKRAQVTDSTYLNQALKNGQLFVSTLSTDGYYYQGHYTNSEHIAEVTDEDAVAQAEAEYNSTKSKLNYKEESLELELKNIDTELSALTTEYDTVKNLISKNVEKVFTMFSS